MTPKYPFVYQATVLWTEPENYKSVVHHYRIAGIGFCTSLADATKQLEDREGGNLNSIEHIELIGPSDENIIDIPSKWVPILCSTGPEDFLEPIGDNADVTYN